MIIVRPLVATSSVVLMLLAGLMPGPLEAAANEATAPGPAALVEVNQRLAGRSAVIELVSGGSHQKVRDVVVGSETTSFRKKKERSEIPTAEIQRISAKARYRGLKGLGLGMVVGGVIGAATYSEPEEEFPPSYFGEGT